MLQGVPIIMTARFGYDPDAAALFSVACITDVTVKNAVNTLITSAKTNGWWSKCTAIYGFAGDNSCQTYASQYKYNWKDPRDLDAAYRLAFTGSWTYGSTGITGDGSTTYAETKLLASTLTLNDTHLSIFSNTSGTSGVVGDIFSGSGSNIYTLRLSNGSSQYATYSYNDSTSSILVADNGTRTGYFMSSRVSSSDLQLYRGSTSIGSYGSSAGSLAAVEFYIGCGLSFGTPVQFSDRGYSFVTIGAGISSTIEALMYADIVKYNTALGRYDSDVSAFISAASITDITQKTAINMLVLAAKEHGWWSLCNAIYPIVGGNATAHSYNLKNTAQYQLSFNGSWVHSSTGMLPSGAYADTGLNPLSVLSAFSGHISYYSRTGGSISDACEIGAGASGKLNIHIQYGTSANFETCNEVANVSFINSTSSYPSGFYMGSRESSTSNAIYYNSTQKSTSTGTETGNFANATIYIGAQDGAGTPLEYTSRECAFATIGAGISSTIEALMYTDIQTFQTKLGRNV